MARSEPQGEKHVAASKALREYIDSHAGTIPKFCAQHGWDENMRIEIQRVINGTRKRISAKFAARIEAATGGEIRVSAWVDPDESGDDLPAVTPTGTGEG